MAISDKEQSDKGKSDGGRKFAEFYVEDQVLITGPEDGEGIERVVAAVQSELGVELVSARGEETGPLRLRWDFAGDDRIWGCLAKNLEAVPAELLECLAEPLVMRLYNISQRGQVELVSRFVNEAGASLCVRGDPNWLTGYPYSAAGSPYSAAGSPYSAAGSPFMTPGTAVQPHDFWNQWALERIGLIQNGMRATGRCGQGVRVGVFDTSPFAEGGWPVPAGWGHPPLLTVVHPEVFDDFPVPAPPPAQSIRGETPPDPPDLSSHGLSVAGLVYAVAPHSDIYLYRVLDRHARGNLYVLCCALIEFMEGVLLNPDAPNSGIINLSLGLPLPEGWQIEVGTESVFALEIVLAVAHCLGLTVVAAAGNESTRQGPAEPPEFPASQPYAIGVMASNHNDVRSCFSNEGELAAPGGDGYDCGRADEACECPWDKVAGAEDRAAHGLVGPVLPNGDFPYGFARWLGTSFATPLVSGMAALILEHHGGLSPEGVSSVILNHANAGGAEIQGGIIGLPDYL